MFRKTEKNKLEKVIKTLTKDQATALYWTCRGLNQHQIFKKTGMSTGMVAREMGFVYEKLGPRLGITKDIHPKTRNKLLKEYSVYEILMQLIDGDPKNLSRFPIPDELGQQLDVVYGMVKEAYETHKPLTIRLHLGMDRKQLKEIKK